MDVYGNDNNNDDSWGTWSKHVLLEIKRINTNLEKLEEKSARYILEVSSEISRLKVWAVIGSIVVGATVAAVLREVIDKW